MKKKILFIIHCSLFIVHSIFASPYDLILSDDPILNDIRFLSIETKTPFLSFTPPFTQSEIINFLEKINVNSLSPPALNAYNRIRERLTPKAYLNISGKNITTLIDLNATVEGRVRFNEEVSWDTHASEMPPMFSIPVRFYFSDFVQLYIDPIFSVKTGKENADLFMVNIPYDIAEFDERVPRRSYFAAGKEWWSFQIGKDKIRWGTAHSGSLTFNDPDAFYDFARLSLISSNVKYSVLINQMKFDTKNLPMHSNVKIPSNPSEWDNEVITRTTQRYYYLHRLDFSFFNRLSISLMEGLMVGNSPLELRYLNPIILFHSLITWNDYDKWRPMDDMDKNRADMVGSILSLELNYNIINSLSFYGQFVMNEFALPAEKERIPDQPPNALGYLAGFSYSHVFNKWASVFYLEFIYTDPYLSILSSPFGSFLRMHHSSNQIRFIGYPRDTIALTLGSDFFNNDTLSFSGKLSYISKGEHDKFGITWDWTKSSEAAKESTPTGKPWNSFILSVGTKWKIFPNITLGGNITGIYSVNNNYTNKDLFGGEASISVSYNF